MEPHLWLLDWPLTSSVFFPVVIQLVRVIRTLVDQMRMQAAGQAQLQAATSAAQRQAANVLRNAADARAAADQRLAEAEARASAELRAAEVHNESLI